VKGALLHGLTDSPYSMKVPADSLFAQGFEVTLPRLRGHGTLPSMTTHVDGRLDGCGEAGGAHAGRPA